MFDHFRFVLIWNIYEQRKEEFEKNLTFVDLYLSEIIANLQNRT